MIYETKLILNIWRYEPMTSNDLKQKIDNALSRQPSRWMEKALRDETNEPWLERSADIALRILGALQATGMSQKALAEKIGVSPQQVSKLLRGNENLTLETIAKLEAALGIVLIAIPESVTLSSDVEISRTQGPKKSVSKMRETKTLLPVQQGRAAEKVQETGKGYGKELQERGKPKRGVKRI